MKKCLPAALIILSVLTAGCFSSSDVELVKNGSFSGYPNTTIGKILDSSFEKAKWSSSQTTIGETIVRFDGRISEKLHEKMDTKLYQSRFQVQSATPSPWVLASSKKTS